MELLLLSNSTNPGRGFLEHAREAIRDVLGGRDRLLFVPWAGTRPQEYTDRVAHALAPAGVRVEGLDRRRAEQQLAAAQAVFVGGGNTFRLVKALQESGLMALLRERARAAGVYIGSSAGSNLACPTLRTTNDMPIVSPPSFETLGLLPFQINPHYLDADPASVHMGETREQRIEEFLEDNDMAVLGLREGSWLRGSGTSLHLGGSAGARLFHRGRAPRELDRGADVSYLLAGRYRYDVGVEG